MAWKASTYDPNSQLGRLTGKKWSISSPAEQQHLVDIGAYTPEGLGHTHIPSQDLFQKAGHTLGSVAKVAAPFAGLIPGVGPELAAVLAAGGETAGRALHGDRFDLASTLGAGAAGYAGAKARGAGSATGA